MALEQKLKTAGGNKKLMHYMKDSSAITDQACKKDLIRKKEEITENPSKLELMATRKEGHAEAEERKKTEEEILTNIRM